MAGQSLLGPTGYVRAPSVRTLPYKQAGFGLHRFVVGLSLGWPKRTEFGVSFDLQDATPITPFTRDTYRARAPAFSLHAKHQLFSQPQNPWGAALGVWRHTYYGAVSPPWWGPFQLEGGPTLRRRTNETHQPGHFLAAGVNFATHSVFADYHSGYPGAGLGWRYALSEAIRLDLSLSGLGRKADNFDRFTFGLTIAN